MHQEKHSVKSPLLMSPKSTALVVVDVQAKLAPHIEDHEHLIWNLVRLIDGANVLEIPVFSTEQYPKGLGPTVNEIRGKIPPENRFEKRMFSIRECHLLFERLAELEIQSVVLTGIESHVCVMQSAFDLMAAGFDVFVCIDAIGARNEDDDMTSMQRLETSGANLVTTEMTLFEWCETSRSPKFKEISAIVQRSFESVAD